MSDTSEQVPPVSAPTARPRAHCGRCGAEIVWLQMPGSGKWNPANAESVNPGDTEFQWGRHVSHLTTCR